VKCHTVVRAFLASPGDAAAERNALTEVVEELNLTWADFVGTRVELIRWESHALPSAGPDPQAAINDQLLSDDQYEIFIGIVKGRLGTPTPRSSSGTVEEFERAYARYSSSGVPEIMFYLQVEVEQDAETAAFKQHLKDLGVFFWSYHSDRQFEQACRIHLSRQIQRVARGDFARQEQERIFPDLEELDLSSALQAVSSLLDAGTSSLDQYIERGSKLTELTRGIVHDMQATQEKLNSLGRPGFRQPKGGKAGILRGFAKKLDTYAEGMGQLAQELMIPYSAGLDAYSRALAIMAPMAPLPLLFRPWVEGSRKTIGGVGRSLSGLRSSADDARNAFAEWKQLDVQALNDAKRRALGAFDSLDRELTSGVHLTREIERLAEEFLRC